VDPAIFLGKGFIGEHGAGAVEQRMKLAKPVLAKVDAGFAAYSCDRPEEDMRYLAITLLGLTLASCSGRRAIHDDPINVLAQKLNASHGSWINGLSPDISLPPEATPEEVLAQALKMTGFDQGHIKTCQIREVRQVQLNRTGRMESYSAALVESDLGTKILLFKHMGKKWWWTRFYDVSHE
jgi:hypothetical protein